MTDSTSPSIPYGRLMHEAVCGVIREVLGKVAREGLPGEHHFFITFDTRHEDVELADWLKERYPEEMMIVIQNWYDDLQVEENGFAITLNFGDAPERLKVPFDSIATFVDPSVEFGWRFEQTDDEVDGDDPSPDGPGAPDDGPGGGGGADGDDAPVKEAEVVSLDTFRRNH
jgi:hypothetical protein